MCTLIGCCLTSWFSKKQTALAISTTEAEYVSAKKSCQQALWMKQALVDYNIILDDIPILCYNEGAIDLSKNPVLHSRTKHIKIHHHFLRNNVQKGNISIKKVSFEDNIADILIKPLKREPFNLVRLVAGSIKKQSRFPSANRTGRTDNTVQNLSKRILAHPKVISTSTNLSSTGTTQPSKHSSPLSINLDPIELIFSTPPTSSHALFDSLEDLPPRTTNPPLPRLSFESIKRLANQSPPLPAMEPSLPPFPP
ncbi:hypothetical protein Tco_1395245 [Tanacetum coccineum]